MSIMKRSAQQGGKTLNIDISADDDLTQESYDLRIYSGAIVKMPAAWTAASLGFYVCEKSDGTFVPLYDHDGNIVQISSPAVDTAYEFPPEVFAAPYVKLWSQTSASGVAQLADRALIVFGKS